jgi:hypothetical protein
LLGDAAGRVDPDGCVFLRQQADELKEVIFGGALLPQAHALLMTNSYQQQRHDNDD